MSWIKPDSVQKYTDIVTMYDAVDILHDRDFQRRFNGFFRVRRNAEWQGHFYSTFAKYKNKNTIPTYRQILTDIYNKTNRVEKSFASKALHMLDKNLPILDSIVIKNLGLKDTTGRIKDPQQKIDRACALYEDIKSKIYAYRDSPNGQKRIQEFKDAMGKDILAHVTPTKIIDFYFWGN